jgi:hypothetical protein
MRAFASTTVVIKGHIKVGATKAGLQSAVGVRGIDQEVKAGK